MTWRNLRPPCQVRKSPRPQATGAETEAQRRDVLRVTELHRGRAGPGTPQGPSWARFIPSRRKQLTRSLEFESNRESSRSEVAFKHSRNQCASLHPPHPHSWSGGPGLPLRETPRGRGQVAAASSSHSLPLLCWVTSEPAPGRPPSGPLILLQLSRAHSWVLSHSHVWGPGCFPPP